MDYQAYMYGVDAVLDNPQHVKDKSDQNNGLRFRINDLFIFLVFVNLI